MAQVQNSLMICGLLHDGCMDVGVPKQVQRINPMMSYVQLDQKQL